MAEDDKSDIKIKIGAEMSKLLSAVDKTLSFIKVKYAATFLAVKKIMDKVAETKLNTVVKQQEQIFGSLSTTLDVISRKYEMATYKIERMTNAIKNQNSAEIQRIAAFRAINAARFDLMRRETLVPGMTARQTFETNARIDAAQRQVDINDATKEQDLQERNSQADIDRLTNSIAANTERRQKLERLRRMVRVAQNAIPDAELADTDFISIVTGNKGGAKNNINKLFAQTFGTNFNVSDFWNDPLIQNFRGKFSELQGQITSQINDAIKTSNSLDDDLVKAKAEYERIRDAGRANLVTMMKENNVAKIEAARNFEYESRVENSQRGRYLADRDRNVMLATRELEWAKRMEAASWKEQISITKERQRFYENLASEERKLLKKYAGRKEEDLNAEEKAIRGEIENRLHSYEDMGRTIGESLRILQKSSGDAAAYAFKAGWNDIYESRGEANRQLMQSMSGVNQGISAIMNGDHWLTQYNKANSKLNALAVKYGAKTDKNGNIDYRTMDFNALRNNEYDSARFDRLQGKVETYRSKMAASAADIVRYRQDLAARNVEAMKNSNRLTAMGLGGGETISFSRETAINTREANKILSQILTALGTGNGAAVGSWAM